MKKSRILVVDDEKSIIDSYHRILEASQNQPQSDFHKSAASIFSANDSEPVETELHLKDDPFEIIDALNGTEAIQAVKNAREENNPINLVFLDMRMPPGIDGRETAKRIREIDKAVEIVIMTAYSDYSFAEIVQEVGTEERLLYLKKPFTAEQIEQLASSLTNRWHTEQTLSEEPDVGQVSDDEILSVDLSKTPESISQWIEYVKAIDVVWKNQADRVYEKKMDVKHPDYLQYNQLRYYVQRYILNSLKQAVQKSQEEQNEYLKSMVPFNSVDDFNLMISHFFFIRYESETETSNFSFFRDPYVQECFILSDLLKVRKTIDIIDWILKAIEEGKSFKSTIKSDELKVSVLKNCRRVMKMIFIQCVRTEYQNHLYNEIDTGFITIESIQNRKKERLEYSWDGILKGERYRRIFLHMVFRNFIETEIKGKHLEIEYDFIQFEQLKRDFFTDWLIRLGDNPVKKELIKKIKQEKKPLLKQMLEEELLKRLTVTEFDDLVAEINSKLPADLKSPVEPLSENHGTLKSVKANLLEIKEAINKEAFSTTSVERMPDVLKGLSSISDQRAAHSIWQMFEATITRDEENDSLGTSDFEFLLTDFAMSGPVNVLAIVPSLFIDLYSPLLKKAFEKAEISQFQVLPENKLTNEDITNHKIVIFFRVNPLELIQNLDIELDNLIGVDVYEFNVNQAKITRKLVKDLNVDTNRELLFKIKDQTQKLELEKHVDNILKDPYIIFEENWKAGTVTDTSNQLEGNVDHFLTQLVGVIKWTIIEGMIAAGHLQSLTKTLASIDKVLVVFPGIKNPFKQLGKPVQTPGNWVVWGEPAFKRFSNSLPNFKSLNVETLFEKYFLNNYEMVLILDFENANEAEFLMHVGIKEPFSINQKEKQNQIFCINLHQVFKYQRFLERCNYILETYDNESSNVSLKKESFWKLIEDTKNYLKLNYDLSDTKKRKIQSRWTNSSTLEQDLINRISLRMKFFHECYKSRQPV